MTGAHNEAEQFDETYHLHDKWVERVGAPSRGDLWRKDDTIYVVAEVLWTPGIENTCVVLGLEAFEEREP